jgi:hypothetical protein
MIHNGKSFPCPICRHEETHVPSCHLLRLHWELDRIALTYADLKTIGKFEECEVSLRRITSPKPGWTLEEHLF